MAARFMIYSIYKGNKKLKFYNLGVGGVGAAIRSMWAKRDLPEGCFFDALENVLKFRANGDNEEHVVWKLNPRRVAGYINFPDYSIQIKRQL